MKSLSCFFPFHSRTLLFENGKVVDLAKRIVNKPLAKTLRSIAKNPDDFYTGSLAENVVKDIQDAGGIMTLDDLANYEVATRKVLVDKIKDWSLYTMGAPTGGPILTHILNILKGDFSIFCLHIFYCKWYFSYIININSILVGGKHESKICRKLF